MALTVEELKRVFGGREENLKCDIQILFELKSLINNYEKEQELHYHQEQDEILNKIKEEFLTKRIREKIENCRGCGLIYSDCHTQKVPGEGCTLAPLMLIGEAPGYEEDLMGRPFVGRAGQLLTRILNRLGINREKVYITNIIKCRPPSNRDPIKKEIAACSEIIEMEIAVIKPKVIITLGSTALKFIKEGSSIIRDRGKWIMYRNKIPVMPTFHPSYILRQHGTSEARVKWQVWEDFHKALDKVRELAPDYPYK